MTAANPIDVIEAGYCLDVDDRGWLLGVASALRPLLDDGFGVFAYAFDVRVPPERWYDDAVSLGAHPETFDWARRMARAGPEVDLKTQVDPDVLKSALEGLRDAGIADTRAVPVWDDYCQRIGIEDMFSLRTIEPGGRGIAIVGGQASARRTDRRAQRLWARVSAHLASARRLRAVLGTTTDDDPHPEAILTLRGGSSTRRRAPRLPRRVKRYAKPSSGRSTPEAVSARRILGARRRRGARSWLAAGRSSTASSATAAASSWPVRTSTPCPIRGR